MLKEREVRSKEFNALVNDIYKRARFLVAYLGEERPGGSKGFKLQLNFPTSRDELSQKVVGVQVPYIEQCLGRSHPLKTLTVWETVKGGILIDLSANMENVGHGREDEWPIHRFGLAIEKAGFLRKQTFRYFETLEGYRFADKHRMQHTRPVNTWRGDRMEEIAVFTVLLDNVARAFGSD